MEKEVVVIKVNDTAYIGYQADKLVDLDKQEAAPVAPQPVEYTNADEVRF